MGRLKKKSIDFLQLVSKQDVRWGCKEQEQTSLHLMCHSVAFVSSKHSIVGAHKLFFQEKIRELQVKKILAFIQETYMVPNKMGVVNDDAMDYRNWVTQKRRTISFG